MKMVEEYIQNEDKTLSNTQRTTVNLNKDGGWFFVAHIQDKQRYQQLVDFYANFIARTVAKVRQVGMT